MPDKINPDAGLLLAWDKATNGSNEHDMARSRWYYLYLCEQGDPKKLQWTVETMYRTLRMLRKQNGYDQFQR